jgi:hypothetical protein
MNKKMYSIILGAVLIGAFFLPYMSVFGMDISGFKIATAKGGDWQQYLLLIIPISGIMLLIGALNNGNYPGGRTIWTWLPLLGVLWLAVIAPLIEGVAIGDIFNALFKGKGIGFWLTLVTSIAAIAYNPKD